MLLIFQMCLSSFLHFAYDNRKDHVKRELLSQRRWPDKWGFLANEYRQVRGFTQYLGHLDG